MKKTLVTMALAGCVAFGMNAIPLFAQDSAPPPPPPPMQQGMGGMHRGMQMHHRRMTPERQLKHLTQVLDLTADQQAQIRPILVERDQNMRAVWQDNSLTRTQRREKMMTLREESKTKIESVLNTEQKQKYEEMYKMRGQRMNKGWQRRGGPPPPMMHRGMGGMHQGMRGMHRGMMTPEQQLKHLTMALNLTAAQQAQIKPILTERDQKMHAVWQEHAQERAQMHQQMMAAAQESKAKIESVLNPEQKQKYEQMLQQRRDRMHQRWQKRGGPPPPPPQ